jgi:hypothetical protein
MLMQLNLVQIFMNIGGNCLRLQKNELEISDWLDNNEFQKFIQNTPSDLVSKCFLRHCR